MSEKTTQKSPEDRFQDAFQRIERAIIRWSKVRGPFDALLIQAAEKTLRLRVQQGAARFDTTDQITLFKSLEARAAEMRDHRNFTRSIPPATIPPAEASDEVRRHLDRIIEELRPGTEFTADGTWRASGLPRDKFHVAFHDLVSERADIVLAVEDDPPIYMKLDNTPEPLPEKLRTGSLAPPPEPEP